MWISVTLRADAARAEALSDALMDHGAISVSLEDDDAGTDAERPQFGEPGMAAAPLWDRSRVIALFDADTDLAGALGRASGAAGMAQVPEFTTEQVADQNWVQLTQSQFDPIRITDRLWIVPSWHTAPDANAINIALDPGMAFGTGSHATTQLCLEWLEQTVSPGCSVIDYGCGSGILAIAAARLGAGRVTGVNIDDKAVERGARQRAAKSGRYRFGPVDRTVASAVRPCRRQHPHQPVVRTCTRAVCIGRARRPARVVRRARNAKRAGYCGLRAVDQPARRKNAGRLGAAGRPQGVMRTRCPACQTVFRVSSEQLHVREGKVRCGHCRHVFNALDTLDADAGAAPPATPPATGRSPLFILEERPGSDASLDPPADDVQVGAFADATEGSGERESAPGPAPESTAESDPESRRRGVRDAMAGDGIIPTALFMKKASAPEKKSVAEKKSLPTPMAAPVLTVSPAKPLEARQPGGKSSAEAGAKWKQAFEFDLIVNAPHSPLAKPPPGAMRATDAPSGATPDTPDSKREIPPSAQNASAYAAVPVLSADSAIGVAMAPRRHRQGGAQTRRTQARRTVRRAGRVYRRSDGHTHPASRFSGS